MYCRKVRTSDLRQPADAAHKALVDMCAVLLSWRVVVRITLLD